MMSTRAQRRANKRNAKESTGPQSEAGKQRSSQNALKHGLRSQHPVIPGEDPLEYQHHVDELRADIQPVNALEDTLVTRIADTSWRLRRICRIQAAIERDHIEEAAGKEKNVGKDDGQIMGYAFTTHGRLDYLGKLARYEGQLSRSYHRAIKDLTEMRKNRRQLLCRIRAMDERDREEQHWRERHRQPPSDTPSLRPIAVEKNGAPNGHTPSEHTKTAEQSQSRVTSFDATPMDDFNEDNPGEVLRRIEQELDAMMSETGQPGRREVKI